MSIDFFKGIIKLTLLEILALMKIVIIFQQSIPEGKFLSFFIKFIMFLANQNREEVPPKINPIISFESNSVTLSFESAIQNKVEITFRCFLP